MPTYGCTRVSALDQDLGLSSPALGPVASGAGLGAVFLASALVVLGSAIITAELLRRPRAVQASRRPR